MKIAVDLSPLQNAHRMRGIGFTLINFLNNLPKEESQKHKYVFYVLPEGEAWFENPFELLKLGNIDYEVRTLERTKQIPALLPGRLNMPLGAINRILRFSAFYFGHCRMSSLSDIDVVLQADQNQTLPISRKIRKVLIIYDLIPHILEWDYLWGYRTARLRGNSILKSFIISAKRSLLSRKIRRNTKKADYLVAISDQTKNDFIKLLSVPSKKITVIPLGVKESRDNISDKPKLIQFKHTGWGYVKKQLNIDPKIPFLLFVGGVDSRRKLDDLVSAFNNLRARGKNLKLVLTGDIMLGPLAITTPQIKEALKKSSYLEDIIFMGFTDDESRDWLYAHALAFVFPSRYEGFGLPVLEALIHGCPVISYKNKAVEEVAGTAPIYTENIGGLMDNIQKLLEADKGYLDSLKQRGIDQAKKYTWPRTSASIFSIITKS